MSDEHTGLPVLPATSWDGVVTQELAVNALTLRDYFAAAALPALVEWATADTASKVPDIAHFAYEFADAMLAERAK